LGKALDDGRQWPIPSRWRLRGALDHRQIYRICNALLIVTAPKLL
jgi:hypothetical protein